ncbi:hypothetical protein IF2G_05562 [Cordyceps javanica]|nr:hypothetical protein IF2G_05562 [Cordyceps javanica]
MGRRQKITSVVATLTADPLHESLTVLSHLLTIRTMKALTACLLWCRMITKLSTLRSSCLFQAFDSL